jgi:hypothetical protein
VLRRRYRDRSAKRTVHVGRCFNPTFVSVGIDQFHPTACRADNLHTARLDHSRSDSRTQKQSKPNQYKTSYKFGVPQGLHSCILPRIAVIAILPTNAKNKPVDSSTRKLLILLTSNPRPCGLWAVTVRKMR